MAYIERTDALRIVDEHHGARQAYQRIRKIPAANVAPVVHGRWKKCRIPVPVYGGVEISCSICGRITAHEYNYCPNCGARMDGDG